MNRTIVILLGFILILMSCENQIIQKTKEQNQKIKNQKQSSTKQDEIIQIDKETKEKQEQIIEEHLEKGAWQYWVFSSRWQEEIDAGLAKDSTIAYLWQQKAMPMFKQGKAELAIKYLDKAVKYDRAKWQDYRAFMKCIFAKNYTAAIEDFQDCKKRFGNSYVMDHSYDFYIALSYLQLNEFEKAEKILEKDVARMLKEQGEDLVHHLDLFYLGIAKYELKKYEEAIQAFDRALEKYPEFSDVQYYKGICYESLGEPEKYKALIKEAKKNADNDFTINEDNAIFERYPYQVLWH